MKKFYLIFAVFIILALTGCSHVPTGDDSGAVSSLKPASKIIHGHGLALHRTDPNQLFIATHEGLLVLMNEKDLYQVGDSNDDYMGFSAHPDIPNVFFTSGHGHSGGNLGFQKSEDSGKTWQKISNGVNGPVDFHTMTVSPVNPDILYGWHFDSIQRTVDGGKNWEILRTNLDSAVLGLTAHPKDENILFATTLGGIFVSKNKGMSFENFSEALSGTAVLFLAIDPMNPDKMFSMSEKFGFAVSMDAGKSWQKISGNFNGDMPFYLAISPLDSRIMYVMTKKNALYKSSDGGNFWAIVYRNRNIAL